MRMLHIIHVVEFETRRSHWLVHGLYLRRVQYGRNCVFSVSLLGGGRESERGGISRNIVANNLATMPHSPAQGHCAVVSYRRRAFVCAFRYVERCGADPSRLCFGTGYACTGTIQAGVSITDFLGTNHALPTSPNRDRAS